MLYLTALSTSDTEERKSLGRSRRRGIAGSSAETWSGSSRYLGLIFTTHGAARVPLYRCGRRSHQGGILRFVLTAAGTATSPFLCQHTGAKVDITSIRHREAALGGKENPRWDLEEEDDAAEKVGNEGIRAFLGEHVYFIYK
jgi:hypothetical protein